MGRVEGKVAFVTGAARGQGRSHAIRLAEEGADIIAVDLCKDIGSTPYSLGTSEDLAETARFVEKFGRRIVTFEADVREKHELRAALKAGVAELGHLDIVVANAGIAPMGGGPEIQGWLDVIGVNLEGVLNTIHESIPYLQAGGSIIATGSAAAYMPTEEVADPGADPGGTGYSVAKRALSSYVHELARVLARHMIRANVVHPTNCDTAMLQSDAMYKAFRPDLEQPTREDAEQAFPYQQAMPIPFVDPVDISNAVLYLASDESRYVTGTQLRVDGGSYLKFHGWHL